MKYCFIPITLDYLNMIKAWEYDGVVKGIYTDPYFESNNDGNEQLRGPGGCYGYAVLNEDGLIGLFEFYLNDDDMEIGLALEPNMVGIGLGKEFVIEGIKFGVKEFNYSKKYIKLSVDIDNKPAIRVYEKVGFIKKSEDDKEITMYWHL